MPRPDAERTEQVDRATWMVAGTVMLGSVMSVVDTNVALHPSEPIRACAPQVSLRCPDLRGPSTRLTAMASFLTTAIHDGSPWLILACLMVFAGVVIGLYTRSGSEISSHPYTKGGELGADPPPETTGREELEPLLSPRRAGRRARRKQR